MTRTIIVPVDGATNCKLEVLDFTSLRHLSSLSRLTPQAEFDGLACNDTGAELSWFDQAIRDLPVELRSDPAVLAPVARGASGGLVGADGCFCEVPGRGLTLAYTQHYPSQVEERFQLLAGDADMFFRETGSIRDLPGALTLLKRFVFEEMIRPSVLARASGFATYGTLMAGHFLADHLSAIRLAGNEHSYWLCHTGTRDITAAPGTPSRTALSIPAFSRLVPTASSLVYRPLGRIPTTKAADLGLCASPLVIPGGHDTCLSHIPVMAAFRSATGGKGPVIHVDGGTWTMVAQVGGRTDLALVDRQRDVIVQGTVDGEGVATSRYAGGADFKCLRQLLSTSGLDSSINLDERSLSKLADQAPFFVLPGLCADLRGSGPFPHSSGQIINESAFRADGRAALALGNLATVCVTAAQVDLVSHDPTTPIVVTSGAARSPHFGAMLAALTGRQVFALTSSDGEVVSETTTLGAAICGKAACLGLHPYEVSLSELGLRCQLVPGFQPSTIVSLRAYRNRWLEVLRTIN